MPFHGEQVFRRQERAVTHVIFRGVVRESEKEHARALILPYEIRLLLIVIISGALGSYIHSATSFVDFVGNRTITSSWVWWYILRTFIGMALSVVLYFVVRAGFISINASSADINPFGFAAIAGMAGMFSKQAMEKLREVFDNLFKTEKGTSREDPLTGSDVTEEDENVQ
jgi:hypothetical protein